jgi:hypothetical protein
MNRRRLKSLGLAILVLGLWALYFAICSAPTGAAFVYVDF